MLQHISKWFAALPVRGQMTWGCLAVLTLSSCLLYGLGGVSYLIRPYLIPVPIALGTVIPRPTLLATPTQAPPSTLQLPGSTLEATPTQAPLPTRAPTSTPTPGGIPTITPQESPFVTELPIFTDTPVIVIITRTPTTTPRPPTDTPIPRPTRTRRPTRTPTTPGSNINLRATPSQPGSPSE